ncbi:MAG: hypothetical protein IJ093_01320 [Bacilli bacterium]|nr:hypothetical protein [Bacilli bacterium]
MDAVLDNIKVENEKITSTKTIKKKNVIFTVEMPKSLNLAANTGTTTMTVTAEFQNISDISNYTSSETQSINIELTATQNALAGGTEESFTGTLYSKSTDSVNVGDSVLMQAWCAVRKASQGYCSVNESEEYDSCTDEGWGYLDYDECLADIAGWKGATCEPGTVPVYNSCIDGDNYFESFESCQNDIPDENYTCEQGYEVIDMKKYLEFISSNYVYLKHNVVNGFIESNEVCLSSDGTNELACVSANNLENSRDTFASVLGNESYNENDKVYTYSKKINYSTFISTIDFGGNVRVRRSHGCGQYDLCILNSDGSASCLYNQSDPNAMC